MLHVPGKEPVDIFRPHKPGQRRSPMLTDKTIKLLPGIRGPTGMCCQIMMASSALGMWSPGRADFVFTMPFVGSYLTMECAACHNTIGKAGVTSLLTCTGCGLVKYCSKACQKVHWRDQHHKRVCGRAREVDAEEGMDCRLFDWRFTYKQQQKAKQTAAGASVSDKEEEGNEAEKEKKEKENGKKEEKAEGTHTHTHTQDDKDKEDEERHNPILLAFHDSRIYLPDRGMSLPLPPIAYGCVDPNAVALPAGRTVIVNCGRGVVEAQGWAHEQLELTGPKTVGQVLRAVFRAICLRPVGEEGEEEEEEEVPQNHVVHEQGQEGRRPTKGSKEGLPDDCTVCPLNAFAGIVRDGWCNKGPKVAPFYKVLWSRSFCLTLMRPELCVVSVADTNPEEAANWGPVEEWPMGFLCQWLTDVQGVIAHPAR